MISDGAPFTGVVTTGIYCRPGCGATPLPEHTRPFALAAAAEAAGFRPCRRCRPDQVSEPGGWVGPSELACRAVRLIAAGGLDGTTEADLAARLGVSARHLRRLFVEHAGATPGAVARSHRTHFARRLLDDTDLPVAQVAFAAGFGSTRQLNREVRATFGASPSELRRRRHRADRPAADGGLELRLPYRRPLDAGALVGYLGTRAIPGVEAVDGGWYRRTVNVDGRPGVVELAIGGDTGSDATQGFGHLRLRAHLPTWDGLVHLVARARRLCDLDADPAAVAAVLGRDPRLAASLAQRPGLRVPGAFDPFELGVRAILGQQVSVRGATTLAGRLAARFGTPVAGLEDLGLGHLFPSPQQLAETPVARLAAIGLPERRAAAVGGFARVVADGTLRLDGATDPVGLVEELCRLPGIGPWTAHYLAMRTGADRDALPAADLGLRRALAGGGPLPSPAEVQRRAEGWRPWRSYAVLHLWSGG